jgi:hypothetical protein
MVKTVKQRNRILKKKSAKNRILAKSIRVSRETRTIQRQQIQDEITRNPHLTFDNEMEYDQENNCGEMWLSIDSSNELSSDDSLLPHYEDHYEDVFVLSDTENLDVDRSLLLREIRRMRDGLKNKNWLTEYECPHSGEVHVSPKRKRAPAKRVDLEWLGATVFPVKPYTGVKISKGNQKAKGTSKNVTQLRKYLGVLKESQRERRCSLLEPGVKGKQSRLDVNTVNVQPFRARLQERNIKSEPESPPPRSSNLRTVFRTIGDTTIEPPSDNTPNSKKIEIINLLTPEPNPNPRS